MNDYYNQLVVTPKMLRDIQRSYDDMHTRLDTERQLTASLKQQHADAQREATKNKDRVATLEREAEALKSASLVSKKERRRHANTVDSLYRQLEEARKLAAKRQTDLVDAVTVNDVVFLFPVVDSDPVVYRELWTSSTELSFSNYFKDMFSSGFIESDTTTLSYPPPEEDSDLEGFDEDDSDAEAEANEPDDISPPRPPHKVHRIVIKDTPYRTYRAFLHFLYTGRVNFAKLRSVAELETADLPPAAAAKKRKQPSRAKSTEPAPKKVKTTAPVPLPPPAPVSPKSLYRLAHLTSHSLLQQECLDHFANTLPLELLLSELFSPFSLLYDDVRKALINVTAENWSALKKLNGSEMIKKELLDGDIQAKSAIAVDLMDKIYEKMEDDKEEEEDEEEDSAE